MKAQTLYLAKKTGTHADALAAAGLAHLAYLLTAEHPRTRDAGWCYTVSWPSGAHDLDALEYESVRTDPGYPYVRLKPGDADAPLVHIDYDVQRQRLLASRKMRDDLRKARGGKLTPEDLELLRAAEPMSNWMLFQDLRVLQAFGSYDSLHIAIRDMQPEAFRDAVAAKLSALARREDAASVSTPDAPKVSAVQAFNPTVGKGTNRPKPDGPALGGLPSAYVDWFEEWLRFIGIGRTARATNFGDDIKLVVLAPADLTEAATRVVHDALVNERTAWTPAKSDVLIVLRLAQTLVEHSGLLGGDAIAAEFSMGPSLTPRDVVAGLHTAYFTSLGSARALTNVGFVGLPGWFDVTMANAEAWIDILEEHRAALRMLDEEKSEEADLLLSYRDFLSAGSRDVSALLEFLGTYAVHVMRSRARSRPARAFTTGNLGRLIGHMNDDYSAILGNDGFLAVAAAMRRATVTEQYLKSKKLPQQYEIRYGLFADIKRKAEFRDQLMSTLGEFVSEYNAEAVRAQERAAQSGKKDLRRRPRVTTHQFEELVRVLDQHKPEVVAMLLLAYASAREPREVDHGTPAGDDMGEPVAEDMEGGDEE